MPPALDFFTVPTLSFRELRCLFVIKHARAAHTGSCFFELADWDRVELPSELVTDNRLLIRIIGRNLLPPRA